MVQLYNLDCTHFVTAFCAQPSIAFLAPPLNFSRAAERGFLAGVAPSWLPRELPLLMGVVRACWARDLVNSSICGRQRMTYITHWHSD